MKLKKPGGKYVCVIAAVVVIAAIIILPAVTLADRGEDISQVDSDKSTDTVLPEGGSIALPPVSLLRPTEEIFAVPQEKKNLVDVGLSYGNGALKEFTLSAAEGDMLTFDGGVHSSIKFTFVDGNMFADGEPCEKAYVSAKQPIHLSATNFSYEGDMIIYPGVRGITLVNRLPLETYVKGVISAEIGADGSYESRKAFSVICRTLAYVAKDHGEDFDVCNRNCCQSYRGTYHRDPLNDQAVDDTAGTVITYGGKPCLVAYSSSHGYNSCSSFAAWVGADIPYLRVVRYDNEPLDYGGVWEQTYTYEQLSVFLRGYTKTGVVKSVSIKEFDPYGSTYVYKLSVIDSEGNEGIVEFGGTIMDALRVRSANFTIENIQGGIVLHGIGNGHGVGYSQRGGHQMGVEGYKWQEILNFYFPGTLLSDCQGFEK